MNRRSKLVFATLVPLALGVVFAGLAWACTPANIWLDKGMAPPGDSVTVSGEYFAKDVPVDIYLSTNGSANGRVLGTGVGPSFSVGVTIPGDVAEGTYWIVGYARGGQTNSGGGAPSDAEQLEVRSSQPPAPEEPESPPASGNNPGNNNGGNNNSGAKNPGKAPAQGSTGTARGNENVAATDERAESLPAAVAATPAARDARDASGPVRRDGRSKNVRLGSADADVLKAPIEVGGAPVFAGGTGPSLVPERFGDSSFAGDQSANYLLYGGFLLTIVLLGVGAGFAVAAMERRKAAAGTRRDDQSA